MHYVDDYRNSNEVYFLKCSTHITAHLFICVIKLVQSNELSSHAIAFTSIDCLFSCPHVYSM